jgi:hypothetical protein
MFAASSSSPRMVRNTRIPDGSNRALASTSSQRLVLSARTSALSPILWICLSSPSATLCLEQPSEIGAKRREVPHASLVSSSLQDLQEYRIAAIRAFRQPGHEAVAMEDLVASSEVSLKQMLDQVERYEARCIVGSATPCFSSQRTCPTLRRLQ